MSANGANRRRRAGFALLEALVAIMILATTGLGFAGVLRESLAATRAAREREATVATADRILIAMSLLKRPELEQRLGRRVIGEFLVDVDRPEETLFRIAVFGVDAPELPLLVTVVYRSRPEGS